MERWSKRIGVDDPEVFAERISFVETRDYVRIIQRNEEIYRALYGPRVIARTPASHRPSTGARSPRATMRTDVSLAAEVCMLLV